MSRERDVERGSRAAPDAVLVGRDHPEAIVTGRQVRVVRRPARAGIDPVALEALEPIAEADGLRAAEREGRVAELELVRSGRQPEAFWRVDPGTSRHGLFDDDRGRDRVEKNAGGVRHREALDRREPEAAVAPAPGAVLGAVALDRDNARRGRKRHPIVDAAGLLRRRRELGLGNPEHAAVAGQPEVAAAVLHDLLRGVVEDTFLLAERREAAVAVAREAPARREPVRAVRVLVRRRDDVVRKSVARRERPELSVGEAAHAAAEGADPERARAVCEHREDRVGREAVPRAVGDEPAALEAVQSGGHRPGPHDPLPVDDDRHDRIAGQPVLHGVSLQDRTLEPHEAGPARSDPERTVGAFGDCLDRPAELGEALEPFLAGGAAAQDAVGGARPQGAAAVLEHRPELVFREALALRVHRHASGLDAVEPAVGRADPQAAFTVFGQRENPVAREAVGGAVAQEAPLPEPEDACVGAEPEIPVAIAVERPHERGREPRGLAVERGREPVDVGEPAARPDPHPALGVGQDGDRGARKSVGHGPWHELLAVQARGAPQAAHPQGAGRVLADGSDPRPGQPVAVREGLHRSSFDPGRAEARPGPDPAARVLEERSDLGAVDAADRKGLEPIAAHVDEAAHGADPERAVAGGEQRLHPVVRERRRVARVENREADAVEAHEAFLRPEPEVSVAGLGDGGDRVLRQARVARPRVVPVLRGGDRRIDAGGGPRAEREGERGGRNPRAAKGHDRRRPDSGVYLNPPGTNPRFPGTKGWGSGLNSSEFGACPGRKSEVFRPDPGGVDAARRCSRGGPCDSRGSACPRAPRRSAAKARARCPSRRASW